MARELAVDIGRGSVDRGAFNLADDDGRMGCCEEAIEPDADPDKEGFLCPSLITHCQQLFLLFIGNLTGDVRTTWTMSCVLNVACDDGRQADALIRLGQGLAPMCHVT